MSEASDAAELRTVLDHLKGFGLLARATNVRVGSIEIVMLAAPQEVAESDARRERRAEQDAHDVLFGSA